MPMTTIYFVRHAQPKADWPDDRTKPLTSQGMKDSARVTEALRGIPVDCFISSPYRRSMDTIAGCAAERNMKIHTDERLKERVQGLDGGTSGLLERRWSDFTFCEDGGEALGSVQKRNIEALSEILVSLADKTLVVGTHGTALSTIINYYDLDFGCTEFKKIWMSMPMIIKIVFQRERYMGRETVLEIARGYESAL